MDDHFPLAGELHRAALQHARAGAGQLQHIVVANGVQLARPRSDARVGGVDAVHVRIDLAHVGVNAPGDGHGRGIRAAAAERGDVVVGVDALESGHDRDDPGGQGVQDALVVHLHDFRLVVGAVGLDAGLAPGEAHGLVAHVLDGHGQKRHGHLLAGGQQAVELAGRRRGSHRAGEPHQLVGGLAHGRHHRHHLVALLTHPHQPLRDVLDALRRGNGCAAELRNDQSHDALSFSECGESPFRAFRIDLSHYTKKWKVPPHMSVFRR